MQRFKFKKKSAYLKREERYGWLFVSPFIIGSLTLLIWPIIQSILYAFSEIKISGMERKFIGLENFRYIFTVDPDFVTTFTSSVGSIAYNVPIIIAFSLFVAVILNQNFRGRAFARMLFFLPFVISSGVILDILKQDLFAQSMQEGAGNVYMFKAIGLQEVLINSGMPAQTVEFFGEVVNRIFDLSWAIGVQTLIFIAALQTVSKQLYEAAIVEGATTWERFWKITFPIISPYIYVNIIYTVIDSFTDYSNEMMQLITKALEGTNGIAIHAAMTWTYFLVILAMLGLITLILRKHIVRLDD